MTELLVAHTRALAGGETLSASRIARELAAIALGKGANGDTEAILAVGPGAAWFQLREGQLVDLRRRRAPRLVFEALLEERLERPGEVVLAAALVARGWPGETIRPTSAMSRLYVAVLTLRNLGLRDAIFAQDGGYLLDPGIDVQRKA